MDASLYAIQQRLVELGHDPGPLDGVWGVRTRNAIAGALGVKRARAVSSTAADAPWMELARAELGVKEGAGAAENPVVLKYFADAGGGWAKSDAIPWCAAFVGAMLERAGYACTRSLAARSYLQWGRAVSSPRVGAVAVFKRGAPPSGHVGFVESWTASRVTVLGGNQSNAVTLAEFKRSDLLGMRWPLVA